MARSSLPALLVLSLCGLAFVGPLSSTRRGVQMRGFKDDFYAWKETLSSEDQAKKFSGFQCFFMFFNSCYVMFSEILVLETRVLKLKLRPRKL